ncbi:MAG: hypothetical protein GEU94_14435 [Micromonosporaceae bacterium]|nr:hypothetical protein [Micromonosporaceae bacterium]
MVGYGPDALVAVRPFAQQREGDSVTIGDLERQVFLSIPAEGLDILDSLSTGNTVGEAARRYEQKYGETPDIDDFLQVLAAEGFVASHVATSNGGRDTKPAPAPRWTWTASWITPAIARRVSSWPVAVICVAAVVFSVYLVANDPPLFKDASILLFPEHFAALTWATVALSLIGVLIHELGHLVTARATGVPTRIGFGNRLYYIVAETHMTEIWLRPKRERYRAFLAGPLIDLTTISSLIIFRSAGRQGWIEVPWAVDQLAAALVFVTTIRFVWQTFLFVRTDFYYVIATMFNCKNLMADTEVFLRNMFARLRRSGNVVDQSGIPPKEMRTVRSYALVWLVGRAIAIGVLLIVIFPLLFGYITEGVRYLTGQPSLFGTIDFLTIVALSFIFQGGGVLLWMRSIYRGRKDRQRSGSIPQREPVSAP